MVQDTELIEYNVHSVDSVNEQHTKHHLIAGSSAGKEVRKLRYKMNDS